VATGPVLPFPTLPQGILSRAGFFPFLDLMKFFVRLRQIPPSWSTRYFRPLGRHGPFPPVPSSGALNRPSFLPRDFDPPAQLFFRSLGRYVSPLPWVIELSVFGPCLLYHLWLQVGFFSFLSARFPFGCRRSPRQALLLWFTASRPFPCGNRFLWSLSLVISAVFDSLRNCLNFGPSWVRILAPASKMTFFTADGSIWCSPFFSLFRQKIQPLYKALESTLPLHCVIASRLFSLRSGPQSSLPPTFLRARC